MEIVLRNTLKQMLKRGEVALGTTITIPHPDVAELIGTIGYDWVMIDTEHVPLEVGEVQFLLQAMSFSKTVPIVRVAWNDLVLVKRALDIGAYGVIVPWVNSREEALRAVQAIKYPPIGLRGFGPRRATLRDSDYISTANDELLLGVQIETQKAIDNIDEILSVVGIDAAVVGPADLSLSLGVLFKYEDRKFVSAIEKLVESAKRHKVALGYLAVDDVAKRAAQGFRLLNMSGDYFLLKEIATQSLANARKAVAGAGLDRRQTASG